MRQEDTSDIKIIGNMLLPLNEAYASQMHVLSEELDIHVITCNDIGWLPFKRMGRYIVFNTRFVMRRTPLLSLINGLFFYIFIKFFERKTDTLLLSGGVESEFLKYLNLEKCIPIISTIDDEVKAKKFASEVAPKLKKIIVQSKKLKDKLISYGVGPNKIHFIYPIIDLKKFRYTDPPSLDNFKILFASAPTVEDPDENNFEAKGVPLLLDAFKEFVKEFNDAKLRILWRGKYDKELYGKIKELKLEKSVEVINKLVKNMAEQYTNAHVTAIPFKTSWRSPEIPLSALESLASSRPIVITNVVELAEIIKEHSCGCVSKPTKEDFLLKLKECRKNYDKYQKNCIKTVKRLFTSDINEFKEIL